MYTTDKNLSQNTDTKPIPNKASTTYTYVYQLEITLGHFSLHTCCILGLSLVWLISLIVSRSDNRCDTNKHIFLSCWDFSKEIKKSAIVIFVFANNERKNLFSLYIFSLLAVFCMAYVSCQ